MDNHERRVRYVAAKYQISRPQAENAIRVSYALGDHVSELSYTPAQRRRMRHKRVPPPPRGPQGRQVGLDEAAVIADEQQRVLRAPARDRDGHTLLDRVSDRLRQSGWHVTGSAETPKAR